MKVSDLRAMSPEDLSDRLKELSEDLFHLRFQHATGQLRNSAKIGQTKREVARIRTILEEQRRTAG